MSDKTNAIDENIKTLAQELLDLEKNIILIFSFNSTGKTRLSVEYKNLTKKNNNANHSGVYYNAYSEDLFNWDNDVNNMGEGVKLKITESSLNQFHSALDENKLREKLSLYKPKFDFSFTFFEDRSKGIDYIDFYRPKKENSTEQDTEENTNIKISRGEEQIFIWSFFLTLFDIEALTGQQKSHFFIDDPVSSLDDHNIFVTTATLKNLIEYHYEQRKIIITTHHAGFFSILHDWLTKGSKASEYKKNTQAYILKNTTTELKFLKCDKDVFLYHLELMQVLQNAINDKKLYAYHFAILRQVLENIASFLGVGRFSYTLEQIGIQDEHIANIVNNLSHKNIFRYEAKELVPDNQRLFLDIFNKIQAKYNFKF